MFSIYLSLCLFFFFFFNDTATTEIYTLSLHDALPISTTTSTRSGRRSAALQRRRTATSRSSSWTTPRAMAQSRPCRRCRSEEHTSELQSRQYLVCRLLLEKKKKKINIIYIYY